MACGRQDLHRGRGWNLGIVDHVAGLAVARVDMRQQVFFNAKI